MSTTAGDLTTLHTPASGGGNGAGGAIDSGPRVKDHYSPPPTATALYTGIAGITMTFLALTSAMVVRKGGSMDWVHFTLPSILYLNTAVILASSVVLERGRRLVAQCMTGSGSVSFGTTALYLEFSTCLGVLFLMGQYAAWLQLRSAGLYLATNPSSSFFYVLTVAHALHVLGGVAGLSLASYRFRKMKLRKTTLDLVARYWHFVDVLWIYLLWLLWANI